MLCPLHTMSHKGRQHLSMLSRCLTGAVSTCAYFQCYIQSLTGAVSTCACIICVATSQTQQQELSRVVLSLQTSRCGVSDVYNVRSMRGAQCVMGMDC